MMYHLLCFPYDSENRVSARGRGSRNGCVQSPARRAQDDARSDSKTRGNISGVRTLRAKGAISNHEIHICPTPTDSEKGSEFIILMIGRKRHHLGNLLASWGFSRLAGRRVIAGQIPLTSPPRFPSRVVMRDQGKPRRRYWRDATRRAQTFQSGEIVPQSGIYEAIHEGAHRQPHEVVLIEQDLFPPCDTCADRVRFRLVRTAPYIFTDADFERPE